MDDPKKPVLNQLSDFIAEGKDQFHIFPRWLSDEKMQVYVRKGRHCLFPGALRAATTLDIASVEVYEKGQGTWTEFIAKAHEMNPWEATFCESVLNEDLAVWLMKNGWQPVPGSIPPCFFMPKDTIQYYDAVMKEYKGRRC